MTIREVVKVRRLLNENEFEINYEFWDYALEGSSYKVRVMIDGELIVFDDFDFLEACILFRIKYGLTHPLVFQNRCSDLAFPRSNSKAKLMREWKKLNQGPNKTNLPEIKEEIWL